LAGWVVALFIVAEPLKRMGKFTFADALDFKFDSPAIKLTASISTLVVSVFYLIPQMVGSGAIITPLLGFPHWVGVVLVGSIVIMIVATAGMTSTTFVQFLKGGLLIIFSTVIVFFVLNKGLDLTPSEVYHKFKTIEIAMENQNVISLNNPNYKIVGQTESKGVIFVKLDSAGISTWWKVIQMDDKFILEEALSVATLADGTKLYNGEPKEAEKFYQVGHLSKIIVDGKEVKSTGSLDPFRFISTISESEIVRFAKDILIFGEEKVVVFHQVITSGHDVMKPGLLYKLDSKDSFWPRLDFLSLMLALFLGTSALPHILIRYYTVPSQRAARKSTIVAILAIGFFYILTLYLGLGAMVNGTLDPENSNMAAPLLAKTFGIIIFSIISAIAFATILGTVSGLIVASSGAVAHDLMDKYMKIKMTEKQKVTAGRVSAVFVGIFAIILGIIFENQNVSFLVGLAFAIAASANLPAIVMLLFWKKTTSKGIAWGIIVGMLSALVLILFSPTLWEMYGFSPDAAPIPLKNPGIISIPLGFITLVVVSLLTPKFRSNHE
jgi:cation/acetate symporter